MNTTTQIQRFFRDLDALEGVSFTWKVDPLDRKVIVFEGGIWAVISEGDWNGPDTFCELVSMTEGQEQADGWQPKQIGAWVDAVHLAHHCYRFEVAA